MNFRWKPWCMLVLMTLSVACRGAGSGEVAQAVINSAVAVTAAGVSRSNGGCYASCPTGTTCDSNTGYCVALPCRGRCRSHEQCVENGLDGQCIALTLPGGSVDVVQPPREAKNEP